jgi:hypothetical protein
MRTDRRTEGQKDVTKLKVAFCNFANAPKNTNMFINRHFKSVTESATCYTIIFGPKCEYRIGM